MKKSEKEWVGGTELGLPDPPLPLGSKNSPGPIPRKHHWLLLSASEVHGYLEEKQYVAALAITNRPDPRLYIFEGEGNTQNALVSPVTGVLRLHPTCLCATRHLCAAQQQMARPGTAGNYDSTSCDQRDQIGCRRSDSDICVSRRWHARRCWAESDGHYVGRSGASVSSRKTLIFGPCRRALGF